LFKGFLGFNARIVARGTLETRIRPRRKLYAKNNSWNC